MAPAVAGPMMRRLMNAICISAFADIRPGVGTCDRIVTVCAGPNTLKGIDVSHYKLAAFAIGTAMAGLAGSLYAYYLGSVGPEAFGFPVSVMILATVVIGGMGSMAGSIIAAALLTLLPEWIRFVNDYKLLVFGLLLFAAVRFVPMGLYPAFAQAAARARRRARR